jgi:regulatory protein
MGRPEGGSDLPADPREPLQDALDVAFRLLGRRDRTVAEVRRHLERRGLDEPAIDGAIAELRAQGYLDDDRFAKRFAEDRRTLDAWGAARIERRLLELGVEGDLASAVVAGAGLERECAAAVALLRRRLGRRPTGDRDRARALGVLVRRGYDLELAHDALRAYEREG